MTQLGKNIWDDPNYAIGSVKPSAKAFDLGTAQVPFRNLYVEHIVGGAELINNADWLQWESNVGVDTDVLRLNASNNVELNAPSGQQIDLEINKLRSWYLASDGTWNQDATNGSDIVLNKTVGVIRRADTAGRMFLEPGGTNSTAQGAVLSLSGNTAGGGNNGKVGIQAGDAAAANINLNAQNATGFINFSTQGLEGWRISASRQLLQEATNGSDIVFTKATTAIQLQSGANGRTGTFTLNGATPVVVSNTSLAAGDMIIITRDTIGGTPLAFALTARTNGASFSVTGTATDTSGMRYVLIRIN